MMKKIKLTSEEIASIYIYITTKDISREKESLMSLS